MQQGFVEGEEPSAPKSRGAQPFLAALGLELGATSQLGVFATFLEPCCLNHATIQDRSSCDVESTFGVNCVHVWLPRRQSFVRNDVRSLCSPCSRRKLSTFTASPSTRRSHEDHMVGSPRSRASRRRLYRFHCSADQPFTTDTRRHHGQLREWKWRGQSCLGRGQRPGCHREYRRQLLPHRDSIRRWLGQG